MIPSGWTCGRRIGFLFPHLCHRLTPVGCPDCSNGQIDDPYANRGDRGSYSDYDDYGDVGLPETDDTSGTLEDIEFHEADGEFLVRPGEAFENDLTES